MGESRYENLSVYRREDPVRDGVSLATVQTSSLKFYELRLIQTYIFGYRIKYGLIIIKHHVLGVFSLVECFYNVDHQDLCCSFGIAFLLVKKVDRLLASTLASNLWSAFLRAILHHDDRRVRSISISSKASLLLAGNVHIRACGPAQGQNGPSRYSL